MTKTSTTPTTAELTEREAALREKYPHIVKGSIEPPAAHGPHAGKYTVAIKCSHKGCEQPPRVIASSDAFQVEMCLIHTRQHRAEARKQKLAEKKGKKIAKRTAKRTRKAKAEAK